MVAGLAEEDEKKRENALKRKYELQANIQQYLEERRSVPCLFFGSVLCFFWGQREGLTVESEHEEKEQRAVA